MATPAQDSSQVVSLTDSIVANHPDSGGTVPTLVPDESQLVVRLYSCPAFFLDSYTSYTRKSIMWLCSSHNMESGGYICTVMVIKDVAM